MRKLRYLIIALLAVISIQNVYAEKAEWKELKYFHEIMSKSFHPSEEGNLKPVRENAKALTESAKAWQASTVPAGYNRLKTMKTLKALVRKCETIEEGVKLNKDDKEMKNLITEAHEIFHELVEKCKIPEQEKAK